MRGDALYLADIVEATDAIAGFVAGAQREAFVGNDLVRSAVLQKLAVIGEAATEDAPALRKQVMQILASEYPDARPGKG